MLAMLKACIKKGQPATLLMKLREYLWQVSDLTLPSDSWDYSALLDKVRIEELEQNSRKRKFQHSTPPLEPDSSISEYQRYLQALIRFCWGSGNVVCVGYKPVAGGFELCRGYSLLYLNSWSDLYSRIGHTRFTNLVTGTKGFLNNGSQIFGEAHKPPKLVIKPGKMYYKYLQSPINLCRELIANDPELLLGEIFKCRKRMKKLNSIYALLNYTVSQHRQCYMYYPCSFSGALDVGQVVKQVLALVTRLFELEVWGTSFNRRKIYTLVARIIHASRKSELALEKLLEGVKITDIGWLGKKNNNLKEFGKRKTLFRQFMFWFFNFILQLMEGCLHVTHFSGSSKIGFFGHAHWRKLKQKHVDRYYSKYLTKTNLVFGHDLLHGKLQAFPKKSGVRVICFPNKGRDSREQSQYHSYIKNKVAPVKAILQSLRPGRNLSINDVILQLRTMDPTRMIYYKKFDISSCYDSIPIEHLHEIIKRLLKQDVYYYDFAAKTVGNSENTSQSFSRDSILSVVSSQLFHSVVKTKNWAYLRENGIFQGFNLSACFSELFLDEVVQNIPYQVPEVLVVRYADDFLLLGYSKDSVDQKFSAVLQYLRKFKVSINQAKTKQGTGSLTFCGIHVDLSNLAMTKDYSVPIAMIGSGLGMVFKYAIWIFETRLSSQLLVISQNKSVEADLTKNLRSVVVFLIKSLKVQKFNTNAVFKFIEIMLAKIKEKLVKINGNCHLAYINTIPLNCIKASFLPHLKYHPLKFKQIIKYLENKS